MMIAASAFQSVRKLGFQDYQSLGDLGSGSLIHIQRAFRKKLSWAAMTVSACDIMNMELVHTMADFRIQNAWLTYRYYQSLINFIDSQK